MKLQKSNCYFVCLPQKVIKLLKLNRDDKISVIMSERDNIKGLETVIERKYRTNSIQRATCHITISPKDVKTLGLHKGDEIDYTLLYMDVGGPGILRFTKAPMSIDDRTLYLPDCLQDVDLSELDSPALTADDESALRFAEHLNGDGAT